MSLNVVLFWGHTTRFVIAAAGNSSDPGFVFRLCDRPMVSSIVIGAFTAPVLFEFRFLGLHLGGGGGLLAVSVTDTPGLAD